MSIRDRDMRWCRNGSGEGGLVLKSRQGITSAMSHHLKTIGFICAAILIFVVGVVIAIRFGAEHFTAVSVGLLPALLVLYPTVRLQFGGELSFWQWVAILSLSLVFATLIHNIFGRLT